MSRIVILNQGEQAFLQDGITGVAYTLRLFTNDVTAGLTDSEIEALTEADFTEATFTGYSAAALATLDWTVTQADPTEALNVQKSFTATATITAQNIHGYYVTRDSDGAAHWFEQFDAPIVIEFLNDEIQITPRLTLGDRKDFGGDMTTQVFTADGTWTRPSGLRFVRVRVVGGGGGGGGATSGGGHGSAGFGAAGGDSIKVIQAADLGATETVTIGTGGAGGAAGNNDGTAGTTTSFGAHLSATGGGFGEGSAGSTGDLTSLGGNGGSGSNGDINTNGEDGSNGRVSGGKGAVVGTSGSSVFGGGRRTAGFTNGLDGTSPGAGGSGALAVGATDRAGGAGADGVAIVEEFF